MAMLTHKLTDTELLRFKLARLVLNARRRRKLLNRGEQVRWSSQCNGWVWFPLHIGPLSTLKTPEVPW